MKAPPSRAGLIEKIERCVRLGRSDFEAESETAMDRAVELSSRYDVRPDELSADARAKIATHDVARQLTLLHGHLARRKPGAEDRWQVTRLGADVSANQLLAFAAAKGVCSRFAS